MPGQLFSNILTEEDKIVVIAQKVIEHKGGRPGPIRAIGRAEKAVLDVHLDIPYGCLIPDLAFQIQGKISEICKKELGYKPAKININVDGVYFHTAGEQ